MKKALLTFTLFVLATAGFSQQCLFEKTYDQTFSYLAFRSYPSEIVQLADGWLIVGYKFSCSGAYAMFIDCDGEVVWDYFAAAGYSTYTDVYKIDTLVYASGVDLQGDDYPSVEQNGFVDVFSPSGFQYRLLTDTTFNGGFGSIYVDSTRIITIASDEDFGGIGYGIPKLRFSFVNIYDRSLPLSLPILSLPIAGLKDAFVVDSSIVVQTFNGFFSFDFSGQLQGNSFFTNTDSFAVLQPFSDSLISVGSNSTFSITNTNFQTSIYKSLYLILDTIIDYGLHNNKWIFLAKKGPNYLIAQYDSNVNFIDSFHLNIGCATPTDIALSDSIIAITGYEKIGENFRIFAKTYDYIGNSKKRKGSLSVLSTSLVIDSTEYYETINYVQPPIVVYSARLNYTITVVNNSPDTLKSFCLYSDVVYNMNCYLVYAQSCYDNIALAPTDSMTIELSYYDYIQSGRTKGNNFWLVGLNDGLMNSCSSFASAQALFVDIEDIAAAEAISVFPNPFESIVSFTNLPFGVNIEVYSLQGKALMSIKADNETNINLSELMPGMYIYSITNNQGEQLKTGKLIKE